MAAPATDKKISSIVPECIPKQQQLVNMAAPATDKKISSIVSECVSLEPSKEETLSMPDWTLLPKELLRLISTYLENCFDVIHARSVCHPWRVTFPFPSSLEHPSYPLPDFSDYPRESKELCTIEKVPLILFRTLTPTFPVTYSYSSCLLGDKIDDSMVLPSPLQCSVEVNILGYRSALMKVLDCQILPLGHQYRMTGWGLDKPWETDYRGAAFLPLNIREGRGEFIVLLSYRKVLLLLRSAEMKWMQVNIISEAPCDYLVAFKGRFYVTLSNRDIFVINPYSLEATRLISLEPLYVLRNFMVPSANDELFLVEIIIPRTRQPRFYLKLRVSRLDEKDGKWIGVTDLGDRVLFLNGLLGNCSCSAEELPHGCGLSGNSVLIMDQVDNATHSYQYVHAGDDEDEPSCWRLSATLPVLLTGLSPKL